MRGWRFYFIKRDGILLPARYPYVVSSAIWTPEATQKMELANIEYTRECLINAWRCIEGQKRKLFDLARRRKKA